MSSVEQQKYKSQKLYRLSMSCYWTAKQLVVRSLLTYDNVIEGNTSAVPLQDYQDSLISDVLYRIAKKQCFSAERTFSEDKSIWLFDINIISNNESLFSACADVCADICDDPILLVRVVGFDILYNTWPRLYDIVMYKVGRKRRRRYSTDSLVDITVTYKKG